ncbi:MAG: hypothetical protein KC519_18410, partial [Anaerolineae bacterium]|nr:hypothetical protein [Anaerolineae bacterium]
MIRARDIFLLAVLLPLFFSSSLTAVSQDNLVLEIRRSYFEKIVWSTDGTSIFLVDDDEIQRFDDQFNLLDSANIGYSQAVSFSPNGNLIALLRWDGTIELWNTEGWVYVRELPTKGQSIIRTRWHPGGDTIAILRANANAIEIWDISSLQVIETITVGPDETIRAFEWSPTGDRIAIAFSDSTIAVWDTVSEQISVMFHEHIGEISDVQWSPNGDWIASSDVVHDCHSRIGAFAVWVWDASTGEPLHSFDTLHCSHANPLTWSPDSKYLAATTESG